jgi:hypothetical protein
MNTITRRAAVAAAAAALAGPAIVAATTTAAPAVAATAATTATSAPFCGITWGSTAKVTRPGLLWSGRITGTRAGQHSCYDRFVVDVARGRGTLGYAVRYVTSVTGPGSGLPVALSGGAKLQITVNAPSTTARSTTSFPGWRTFRQLKSLGGFEGYTDYGLGVRARLPMRAFVLVGADGTRHLVVDVAHSW